MKYGAHVYIWQDGYDDDDLARILDSAAQLGLSFLEVAIGGDIRFDACRLGEQAKNRKLELVISPGGEWPMECDISLKNRQQRQSGLDWHRRAIDLAAACSAIAYTGAIYGHPGRVERGLPCPDEPQRIAEGLHRLADYAEQRNIQLVLEPMSHFRSHVANRPGQINRLIDLADHKNLSTLLDTYHMATEVTDLSAAFEQMQPRLWGLHACENNRGAPGTGFLPWKSLAAALLRGRWEGYIGFESYNSSWRNGAFAHERGMFHNVCPDAEAFIAGAKSFLEKRFLDCR